MKIPRNISGSELAKALAKYGYYITRQTGSHLQLTTTENGEHHITIPAHNPLKLGIVSAILGDVAIHAKITKDSLIKELFIKNNTSAG